MALLALLPGTAFAQTAPEIADTRPPQRPEAGIPAKPAPSPEAAPAKVPTAEDRPAARPAAAPKPDAVTEGAAAPAATEADPTKAPEPAAPPIEALGPPIPATLREGPLDYAICRLTLKLLGTAYEELPSISQPDQRDCGIARPIRVTEILPGIALQGGAEMRCDTARALGFWMRDFVRPAAERLPGSPRLTGVTLGTTYDCRGRVGDGGPAKLSEHAFGNAIDISAFTFADAPPIPVEPRQDSGDLVEAFQRAVRGTACLHFTTVLGPGSNASHDDHLHLDIAARKGGWRLCQ